MANEIPVKLAFQGDMSAVKRELKDLKATLDDITVNTSVVNSFGAVDTSIQETIRLTAQLQGQLQASTTKSGNLKLDVLAREFDKAGVSLADYVTKLNSLERVYPGAANAAKQLVNQIQAAYDPINQLSGGISRIFANLTQDIVKTFNYGLINKFTGAIRGAFRYAQNLDRSLNDIRIVTNLNVEQMADFAKQANKAAMALGATTLEYTKGALIYYQQGLSGEDVIERTNATIKLANTSGEAAEQISSYMTGIWNNFDKGSKSVEYYADVISYLGAVTAASNADIAEGVQAFAATAETVGLSFEYATGALTTLVDKTQQSASTIGNSLKTIFARLSSVSLGETLEDDVNLTKYTKALATVGVNVLDANGELRKMDDILDSLGERWSSLSDAQKVAVAQTVGGVRQYNNLISLMDNYGYFKDLVSDAYDSEGYLAKQNTVYLESWAAASDQVKAAWQKIYDLLIDDQMIIKLTKGFASMVSGVGDLIENLGGLKTLLPAIGSLLMYSFGDKITTGIMSVTASLKDFFTFNKTGGGAMAADLRAQASIYKPTDDLTVRTPELDDAINKQTQMSQDFVASRQKMTQAERILREEQLKRNKVLIEQLAAEQKNIQASEEKLNVLKESYDPSTSAAFASLGRAAANQAAADSLFKTGTEYTSDQNYLSYISEKLNNSAILDTRVGKDLKASFGEELFGKEITGLIGKTDLSDEDKAKLAELAGKIKAEIARAIKSYDDKNTGEAGKAVKESMLKSLDANGDYDQIKNQVENYEANQQKLIGLEAEQKKLEENGEATENNTQKKAELQAQIDSLKQTLEGEAGEYAKNKRDLEEVDGKTQQYTEGVKNNTEAKIKNAEATQNLMMLQKKEAAERATLAYNLGYIAQAGMAAVSMVRTLSSCFKTLQDDSKSLGQKLGTVAATIPSLILQFNSLSRAMTTMTENGLFGKGAKASLAGGAGLVEALGGFGHLALIVAAVAGIVAVLVQLYNWYNKDSIAAKSAQKAAEEASTAFEKAKESYNNLKDSIEDYKDAQDAIQNLITGTEEWQNAIDETNEKILALIDSYPQLAEYLQSTIEDGKQVLTLAEGYEDVLSQLKYEQNNARIAKYAAAIGVNSTNSESKITEFARSHHYATTAEVQTASAGSGAYSSTSASNQQETTIQTQYYNFDRDTVVKVVNAISEFGADVVFTTDKLEELGIIDTDLQNAILENKTALIQLNGTIEQNNSKNDALAKAMFESHILNDDTYSDAQKAAILALSDKERDQLSERANDLYNNTYKEGMGVSDAWIQQKYAEAMGYAEVKNKSGNKGAYYDALGNETIINDEVARRWYAMQTAIGEITTQVETELKNLGGGEGSAGYKELMGFLGEGQEGVNKLWLDEDTRSNLIENATVENIGITDEQAKEAGYESAEKFVEAYKEALKNYEQSGISVDFDYGTKDFNKDDEEFLEKYTKRLMELNSELRDSFKSEEEFKLAMRELAIRMMNAGAALKDFNKNIDDYRKTLTKGVKGTEDYERALAAVRKNMSKLLDIDPSSFTEDFLTTKENLDDMEKAANGDVSAFFRLQKAVHNMLNEKIDFTGFEDAKTRIDSFIDYIQNNDANIQIGAELDNQQAIDAYNELLEAGKITAEQVNEELSNIGYEGEVKYVEMPSAGRDVTKQVSYITDPLTGEMRKIETQEELEQYDTVLVPVLSGKDFHYTKPSKTIESQKPKGGGTGSKKETKEKKDPNAEKKRYEVINNKLEETEELLTEIAGKEDRAFGADKVELMEKEMEGLNTQLDQYNKKLKEANDWLKVDKKAMDAYGARYDANGVITNYDQIMDQQIAIYNAAVDRYNRSAQSDADKERFEQAEKAYEKFLKAYEQYNETLDLVGELEQNVLDTIYKIQDKALEIITTQVELNVEVNDRDIELIEYLMKQLEDKAYSAADAISLLGKEAANSLDKIAGYQEGIADILSDVNVAYDEQLQKRLQNGEIDAEEYNRLRQIGDAYTQQFLNGEISAEQYAELVHMDEAHMNKLKEYADAIKDETLKLQELRKEAYEKLGETLEQFNDDLDKQKDKIDKATSALENYRNIVDTFGKKNLGLDDDIFEQMSRAELKAAQSRAAISKTGVDEAKRAMEELEAQVNAATSEEQKRLLQEQLDEATEAYEDALDNWTGDLADAADKVAQVFDDAIDHIVDKFDESVGGLFNNLGDLQEAFDQASTLDDQYVDDYKRVYELNKLNKKIHDSIDNGVTVKSRQLLLSLQDEINKKEAEGVELSEYDLEVYQKRYELYLAQIALEEAQNAKSTVRMSRDNEGNWSYVYVADQAAMDKALDDYNDKLQQYAELNNDYIKTTQDTILSLEKEYQDALAGLDPTDPDYERKLQELQKYYNDRMAFYVQQLNNALDANKEVASYEEAEDWNVKQNFEDTLLGQLTGVASAEEYGEIFDEAVADATAAAMEKYHNYLADLDETTADIEDMAETIAGAIEDVHDVSDEAETEANAIAETFKTAFESAIKELDAFADSYNEDIDSMSFATARLLALINKLNEIKSGQTSNTDMPLPDTAYSDAALREILGDELFNSITNGGTYDNIYGLGNRKIGVGDTGETERQYAISGLAIQGLSEALSHMAEISAAGFGDLTSFLVDHTGKLEQQVTITANFPNVVNHTEIEEAFSNLVNMAAQFANRKN